MLIEAAFALIATLGGQDPPDSVPTTPSLLLTSNDIPSTIVNEIRQVGSGAPGRPDYRVVVRRTGSVVDIVLKIGENREQYFRIRESVYPALDLATLRVHQREEGGRLRTRINFSYGEERPNCYVNHDGRNKIILDFLNTGSVEAIIFDLHECRAEYESAY